MSKLKVRIPTTSTNDTLNESGIADDRIKVIKTDHGTDIRMTDSMTEYLERVAINRFKGDVMGKFEGRAEELDIILDFDEDALVMDGEQDSVDTLTKEVIEFMIHYS